MFLTPEQVLILQGIYNRASITEISRVIGKSVPGTNKKIVYLERKGLINPPPRRGMARSRTLTAKAIEYLEANKITLT